MQIGELGRQDKSCRNLAEITFTSLQPRRVVFTLKGLLVFGRIAVLWKDRCCSPEGLFLATLVYIIYRLIFPFK